MDRRYKTLPMTILIIINICLIIFLSLWFIFVSELSFSKIVNVTEVAIAPLPLDEQPLENVSFLDVISQPMYWIFWIFFVVGLILLTLLTTLTSSKQGSVVCSFTACWIFVFLTISTISLAFHIYTYSYCDELQLIYCKQTPFVGTLALSAFGCFFGFVIIIALWWYMPQTGNDIYTQDENIIGMKRI